MKVINMQEMRYINLFEKITHVRTSNCFSYNDSLIFVVPKKDISKSIGEEGKNTRKLNEILNKKVKVAMKVVSEKDIEKFIASVVHPVTFNNLEIRGGEIVISAGHQSKSALIGRDKRRLIELQKITKEYFNKNVRIA
ncbi:MAG: hypothetical protein AABY22_11450 [Nanoarchaeota archaeon]